MSIARQYIEGLKQAYISNEAQEYWQDFDKLVHGVSVEDTENLKKRFPKIAESLIELLQFVDGTDWRTYKDKELAFIFLGSTLGDYPYYIHSAQQMLDGDRDIEFLRDYINRDLDPEWGITIDEKIIDDFTQVNWLHFSNCINNGGSSQLFIDFSPSDKGKIGQVVMYVHDPDELVVIADSFDDYLQNLINDGFSFINEDIMDDYDL